MNYRKIEFYPEFETLSDEHIAMNSSFYNHLVEYYLNFFEFSLEMVTRTFDDYAKDFIDFLRKSNMKNPVLILGSGCGRDAFWTSQLGLNIQLVDASDSMISFSKKLFVNASFFCQDMNDFLGSLRDTALVYSGILNESGAQHLSKDQVYDQIRLVSEHLAKDGIFLLGLKQAPSNYSTGPVYSVSELEEMRFFVSWSELEISELIEFAKSVGLKLVKSVSAEHLESSQGTPPFIRLYFSPTP
jgi:hypothetical protein